MYKETFTPILGDVLSCKKDNRAETLEYNSNAVGVYKQSAEGGESLAGHVPMELSRLIAKFRNALQGNVVEVELCGEKKREVSLIVPGIYRAIKDQVKSSRKILQEELTRIKDKFEINDFEIEYEQYFSARNFLKINVKKMKRFVIWLFPFTDIPGVGRLLAKHVYYKFSSKSWV